MPTGRLRLNLLCHLDFEGQLQWSLLGFLNRYGPLPLETACDLQPSRSHHVWRRSFRPQIFPELPFLRALTTCSVQFALPWLVKGHRAALFQ